MEKCNFQGNNGNFDLGYLVYEPDNRSKEPLPMIVFLHGAGERGNGKDELERVKVHALPKYIEAGADYPAIVLCPQCPENLVWNNIVVELKRLIDYVAENYNADKHRISVTGISMGGYGSWEMGITYPDFFSAIAPVCGGGFYWRGGILVNMPIWAFHGDKDNVVPVENSYQMIDSIIHSGGNPKFTVFHNVDHGSWDSAYLETNVIDWLISQRRENIHEYSFGKDF
jgi:predicted peptidase